MRKIRIAHLSCGSEHSGVQGEIEKAASQVNAQIVFPEVEIGNVKENAEIFGLQVASPDLRLMIARAKSIVNGDTKADAVFITTCFRCAEGAIVTERGQGLHPPEVRPSGDQLLVHRAHQP